MDILNKPINGFSFEEIADFCSKGEVEGYQLDYKIDLPAKGLAKHFAAFSNTRGGVIIIGVEEDKQTGKPKVWKGIVNEGKIVDRIHQFASNVEPIPSYDVAVTNEVEGKTFILLRIQEGDKTPYYVQNDSNLWVRTGNISSPIDIASPDAIELLFKKSEKADLARGVYINRSYQVYDVALNRAEEERQRLIVQEKEEFERKQKEENERTGATTLKYKSQYVQSKLGTSVSMSTVLIQPFYPSRAFIKPQELKQKLDDIRIRSNWYGDFPNSDMEPIPDGLLNFEWGQNDGNISCQQIYSTGLVFNSIDVLRPADNGEERIYLSHIASQLYITLQSAWKFYQLTKYQGNLTGYLLLRNLGGAVMYRIQPQRWTLWENKKSLLSTIRVDLDLDTSILGDNKKFQSFFLEKIYELYWGIGYEPNQENLYKDYLKENGWLVE